MTSYNLTFPDPSVSTLSEFATFLNTITSGSFWTIGVFFMWAFFFVSLVFTFDEIRALGWSSFITSILSIILVSMGLINNGVVIFMVVLTSLGGLLGYLRGG